MVLACFEATESDDIPASNFPMNPTAASRSAAAAGYRGVDMTSAVKYHGDAGVGRAAASSGLVPDFVGAGVIVSGAMGLSGGIPRSRPPGRSSIVSPLWPSVSSAGVEPP